jgi:hypothetical protein
MLRSRPECPNLSEPDVPKGRRHATSDVQIFGEASLRAVSVIGGARGDRTSQGAGPFHARDWTPARGAASTISRELRRNAATRSGGLEYRATTAQWHADRSARRPKPTKLALNATLRTYVEERLAGVVVAPSGAPVPGPAVPWKGRHGRRKDRRWAKAWSPEQIARRLPIDFPDETMRISHEAIYQALFVQGRGVLRRELTACLRTGRVLRVPRGAYAGEARALSRGYDQPTSCRSGRSSCAGTSGGRPHSRPL